MKKLVNLDCVETFAASVKFIFIVLVNREHEYQLNLLELK